MKQIIIVFIYILFGHLGISQHCIDGTFNSNTQLFETDNKDYWIDFFENGIARISRDGYIIFCTKFQANFP